MAQTKVFTLGVLELAGIGFASGVSSGAAASLAGCNFDTVVPCCAAAGLIGLPLLWLSAGVTWSRRLRRTRRTHVITVPNRLVA